MPLAVVRRVRSTVGVAIVRIDAIRYGPRRWVDLLRLEGDGVEFQVRQQPLVG
jgi:hypothetical protein